MQNVLCISKRNANTSQGDQTVTAASVPRLSECGACRKVLPIDGRYETADDGSSVLFLTSQFQFDGVSGSLDWQIPREVDGKLRHIEINPSNVSEVPANWEIKVADFINEVLIAALAETSTKYFRRNLFYYVGPNLDGEYWLGGLRLAPAVPDDKTPTIFGAERAVHVDQTFSAIDDFHASDIADHSANRLTARLSLVLDVGFYGPLKRHAWTIQHPPTSSSTFSKQCQLGFWDSSSRPTSMPAKGTLCSLGAYRGSIKDYSYINNDILALPLETRPIIRAIAKADVRVRDAADNCARLCQVGLVTGGRYPSVGLAYRIAAVETLAQSEHTSFSDFVRSHTSQSQDLDTFPTFLYGSVRSAHFHSGAFPLGEFMTRRSFAPIDWEGRQQANNQRRGNELLREAMVAWLIEKFLQ